MVMLLVNLFINSVLIRIADAILWIMKYLVALFSSFSLIIIKHIDMVLNSIALQTINQFLLLNPIREEIKTTVIRDIINIIKGYKL